MTETCCKCGRARPNYIADPTCPKGGGYCDWSSKEDEIHGKSGCVLCESWDHCPCNPDGVRASKRSPSINDVETSLVLGYAWGRKGGERGLRLCEDHDEMIAKILVTLKTRTRNTNRND